MQDIKLVFDAPNNEADGMVVEELAFNQTGCPAAPFKASRWEVLPGKTSPLDQHEVCECWLVAKGEGQLSCNGILKGKIQSGDILYFESNKSHSVTNTGTENMLVFSIWWKA